MSWNKKEKIKRTEDVENNLLETETLKMSDSFNIKLRDPWSAITHLVAFFITLGGIVPLLIKATDYGTKYFIAMLVFGITMMLLYAASATYHAITLPASIIKIFRKIDHSAIFVFIAGSYTPVFLIILEPSIGIPMLIAIWAITILGIIVKFAWINCPKWFSSVIYIMMGWMCIFCMSPLIKAITTTAFAWLLVGGIIYTIGGVIYALKLPEFNARHKNFGTHEIFHLFVMVGSFCHFIFMYSFVL